MIFLLLDSNDLFAKDNQLETIGSRSKTGEATKPLDLNNKVLLVDISLQDEVLLSFPMDGSSLVRGGLRPPLDVEPGYTLTVLDLVDARPLSSQLSIAIHYRVRIIQFALKMRSTDKRAGQPDWSRQH